MTVVINGTKAIASEQENDGKRQNFHMHNHYFWGVSSQTILVILSNGAKNIKTNALLFSGSDIALISRQVWSKLESNEVEKKLSIKNAL